MSVLCFIFGLASLMCFWLPIVPFILAIIGIALYDSSEKDGFATAGLVCCIIGIVISIPSSCCATISSGILI